MSVTDSDGRSYRVSREALRSAEAQARVTGPVNAGGTTGLGLPRQGGPQQARPGDVPGRTVVKGAAWADVYDYAGRRVGVVKQADIAVLPAGQALKGRAAATCANVYDSAGRRAGVAKLTDIIPMAAPRAGRGR